MSNGATVPIEAPHRKAAIEKARRENPSVWKIYTVTRDGGNLPQLSKPLSRDLNEYEFK